MLVWWGWKCGVEERYGSGLFKTSTEKASELWKDCKRSRISIVWQTSHKFILKDTSNGLEWTWGENPRDPNSSLSRPQDLLVYRWTREVYTRLVVNENTLKNAEEKKIVVQLWRVRGWSYTVFLYARYMCICWISSTVQLRLYIPPSPLSLTFQKSQHRSHISS